MSTVLGRIAAAGVAVAVLGSAGVAQAAWSKNGTGDGYAKAKTLAAPTGTPTISCNFTAGSNRWTVGGWTPHATAGQSQTITIANGSAVAATTIVANNATTASLTGGSAAGSGYRATVTTTRGSNWTSTGVTSTVGTAITIAGNGHC